MICLAKLLCRARNDRTEFFGDIRSCRKEGMKPYLVPYGGSSPTGALGYAFAMKELVKNLQADWIVFATSSVARACRLVLGQRMLIQRQGARN
jgi:D-cysteine desulfhydrase